MSSKDKEGTSKGRRWRFSRKKMKNNSSSSSGTCVVFFLNIYGHGFLIHAVQQICNELGMLHNVFWIKLKV